MATTRTEPWRWNTQTSTITCLPMLRGSSLRYPHQHKQTCHLSSCISVCVVVVYQLCYMWVGKVIIFRCKVPKGFDLSNVWIWFDMDCANQHSSNWGIDHFQLSDLTCIKIERKSNHRTTIHDLYENTIKYT